MIAARAEPRRRGTAGAALVEALAALVVVAIAAAVVAAAAATSLRAVHEATRIEQAVAAASGELSALQSRRPLTAEETRADRPDLGPTTTSETSVAIAAGVATLAVAVRAAPDAAAVELATKIAVPE